MKLHLDPAALKQLRTARGTRSLREVAVQAGISFNALKNYEDGERDPEEVVLKRLCKVLGLRVVRERVRLVKGPNYPAAQ